MSRRSSDRRRESHDPDTKAMRINGAHVGKMQQRSSHRSCGEDSLASAGKGLEVTNPGCTPMTWGGGDRQAVSGAGGHCGGGPRQSPAKGSAKCRRGVGRLLIDPSSISNNRRTWTGLKCDRPQGGGTQRQTRRKKKQKAKKQKPQIFQHQKKKTQKNVFAPPPPSSDTSSLGNPPTTPSLDYCHLDKRDARFTYAPRQERVKHKATAL